MSPALALILANIIWGIAVPVFKYALNDIPPFTFLFIRFFIASLFFLPTLRHFSYKTLSKREWLMLVSGCIVGFGLHIGLLFIGLQKADSINASIIASSAPLFLFILSILVLREQFKRKVFAGMMLSTVGVAIIVCYPLLIHNGSLNAFEGNMYFVVSTICNVISVVMLKKLSEKVPPLVMTFFTFFISALCFLPFMIIELQTWQLSALHVSGIIGLLYGIFLSSALAYYLFFYGLSKILSQEVGIFSYVDPVASVFVAIPLLHEYPNGFFIFGSLLIFVGIFISEGRIHYHPFHLIHNSNSKQ